VSARGRACVCAVSVCRFSLPLSLSLSLLRSLPCTLRIRLGQIIEKNNKTPTTGRMSYENYEINKKIKLKIIHLSHNNFKNIFAKKSLV